MGRPMAGGDFAGWVDRLASAHWRRRARLHLVGAGAPALPAIQAGLRHGDPMVRRLCASMLDQVADDAAFPDLVAALDDPDTEVRRRALHALSCDGCKRTGCRPDRDLFVPRAIELLRSDPDPDLRAAAIEALAKVAAGRTEVSAALRAAAEGDPDPRLRSMARNRRRVRTA